MSKQFKLRDIPTFSPILIKGKHFKDETGRTLFLRGVNVVAKEPTSCPLDAYCDCKNSFVDANMPIEEADEHFSRLKYCGFTIIRLLVTWEAISWKGADVYDEEYLKYIRTLCSIASNYEISVIIDFHQDVFSRHMSGCGAPSWVIESVGLNPQNFEETGAALFSDKEDKSRHIAWFTNNFRFATATMNTLFFGGNHFFPNLRINSLPVQEYLQSHFEKALIKLLQAIAGLPNIFALDIWNEPSMGLAGCKDLSKYYGFYKLKSSPTPFEGMIAADGNSIEVDFYGIKWFAVRKLGKNLINRKGKRAWQDDKSCIFRNEGIWNYNKEGNPVLLEPSYFNKINGRSVDIFLDLYHPFIKRMTKAARSVNPNLTILLQHLMGHNDPPSHDKELENIIFSAHWYDGIVMSLKKAVQFLAVDSVSYKVTFALPSKIRRVLAKQIHKLRATFSYNYPNAPFILTEIGVSHDLNNKRAYKEKNSRSLTKMIDRTMRAAEDNLTSFVAWCYHVGNTISHGDRFNGEDFSIWSRELQTDPLDPYSGLKQPEALIRPHVRKVPGNLIDMHFCVWKKEFCATFEKDSSIDQPLEIFLPNLHYKSGITIESTGGYSERDKDKQILYFYPKEGELLHSIRILPNVS